MAEEEKMLTLYNCVSHINHFSRVHHDDILQVRFGVQSKTFVSMFLIVDYHNSTIMVPPLPKFVS